MFFVKPLIHVLIFTCAHAVSRYCFWQRERFTELQVRKYVAEIVLTLERLHSVRLVLPI